MSWLALPGIYEVRTVLGAWDRMLCDKACSNAEAAMLSNQVRRVPWVE